MKRHGRRRLRASILTNQAWAIHEPALHALFDLLAPDAPESRLTRAAINERIGVGAEMATTVQMIGSVAVLPVFGILQQRPSWLTRALGWTATEQLERDLKACVANDQVKAVVLYCDSPGGVAAGVDEVAATIFQARKTKPLRGFVRGTCASAAYYLVSACDRIDATPSSTIGSIGTIYTHFEFAEALKQMGLGVTVIKHGERKGDGNPYEKLSPAARASLQHWVTAFGQMFDSAVAKHRDVTVTDVRSRFGQGEAYLAQESKQRGLIDQVGTWEQLLASLKTPAAPLPQPGQRTMSILVAGQQLAATHTLSLADGTLVPSFDLASAIPAGASAGAVPVPSPLASATAEQERPVMKFSMRVRGALLARGLISAVDATDEICQVALGAYCAARGEACPQEDDKILAVLGVASPAASTAAVQTAPPAPAATAAPAAGTAAPAANVQQAHDREMAEARTQAATGERQRQASIRASAQLLNMPAEAVQAAIDGGQPHETVIAGWHQQLGQRDRPISQGSANVSAGQEGSERYVADAALATLLHFGRDVPAAQLTPQIRQLSQAPLLVHAEQCLRMAGVRFDPYDREATAQAALAMDGYEHTVIRAEGAFNRPGSFPNLLSNLANKILDQGAELAETTYAEYVGTWPGDLPDFKPAPVVAKGTVGEFDEVLDAEAFKEHKLDEECLSYMQLARFGNHIALTPVLLANDDVSAFMENLLGLSEGWELTKNRGCLRLVTGNVQLLDSVALYDDATHKNLITAGGAAPSVTTWDAMQQKMAAQTTIGNKGYARARLSIALVPPKHEVAAIQTFAPMRDIAEMKQPATDSNLNVFRGRVKTVVEPDLQLTSNDVWYGFTDPRRVGNATIIIAYFRGWGRSGKRERWYDPQTKCWYVSLEGRAGFAAKQYRTTVRNPGG